MQFAVPQFTEVEDRLIGSLTLKQFFVLLGAGGLVLFFWSLFGPSFIFFIIGIPIGILGVALAFGKYNGRPMFIYLMPFAAYLSSTKVMVFKRESAVTTVSKSEPIIKAGPSEAEAAALEAANEPAESRLKKLAYMLDQKTQEEGDIISRDMQRAIQASHPQPVNLAKSVTETMTHAGSQIKGQIKAAARLLDPTSGKPAARPAAAKPPIPPLARKAAPRAATQAKSAAKPFDPSSFLQI
jgi:hypothetical protein